MKFTVDGIDYEAVEKNGAFSGYFYKTENGKKTRISCAAFVKAREEHTAQQNAKTTVEVEITDDPKTDTANTYKDEIIPAKTKPAKTKKPRKSKDVAHESDGITLTAKQVDFMRHLPDTCFWDDGLDSEIWTDVLCDDIGGQFQGKPMTVGAMISTLCEKGVGVRSIGRVNNHKATVFKLTELGKTIAAQLGIE